MMDCGWLTGSSWTYSKEVDEAIGKLPRLSRLEREEKLVARVKLFDPSEGWEWYLCEFNPETKQAKGLVKALDIESGIICMSSLGEGLQARMTTVFDFNPTNLAEIRRRLSKNIRDDTMTKRDQQFRYDVFVSYASEDEGFASKIVGGLVSRGMRVWYAPLVLKIGDPLRKSIEEGMRESFAGIVILSERYIAKNWTEFEFDTLIRQYIERGKKILPIWHGVNHESIYNFSTGLAGIKAMNSSEDLRHIIGNIVYSLSEAAPTRGIIPSYEDLVFRFLNGRAELLDNNVAGPAFTVWEAALHFPTHRYPIWIEGKLIQRDELLFHVAQLLAHNPGVVIASDKDKKELCRLCKNAGYDVDKMK